MIRKSILIVIVLLILGCDAKQDGSSERNEAADNPAESTSEKPTMEWHSFAKNEWYELLELRVAKNRSVMQWKFVKNDPQVAIGVMIDVGILADSRGFTHIRYKNYIEEKHVEMMRKIGTQKNGSFGMFEIEFFKNEPDDTTDVTDVTDVAALAELGRVRDMKDVEQTQP